MAGGKETPRQKMVGMMYLVLTALLALNVSVTVLDKFVFINESLNQANIETYNRNSVTIRSIIKKAKDLGNRIADKQVVDASNELRNLSKDMYDEITSYKMKIIEETGGYDEGHEKEYDGDSRHLTGKTNYDIAGNFMLPISESGKGNGMKLKNSLNNYVKEVKKLLQANGLSSAEIANFINIALDAEEHPVYKHDPNQKGKKFAQLEFESSPTPAVIASLSEFQSRVLAYETRGLDYLSKKLGAGDLQFDKIVAMVKPESKFVPAGSKYRAEMFIAASSSGITPEMTYNGNKISVDADGKGLVEFVASTSKYEDGGTRSKKSFEAAIKVKMPNGKDTTFSETYEYFVLKPIMQVQSQSVNALYLNCGNKLDVQVPALGNSYNPVFSVSGGQHIKGKGIGLVTVIPTKLGKVKLTVSSGGNKIDSRDFGVRPIPEPTIQARTDRGPVDMKNGISAKTPRLYLSVIPDKGFKEFLPDDAKFRVAQCEVTLVSGGLGRRALTQSSKINLGPIAAQARKGDQLVIEIKKIERQNFRGQVEIFPISKGASFINISLK